MSTYAELLKHPNWQKKRLVILDRDKWTCKACGSKDSTLHVHHFTYQNGKKPWEYPDENFITLCHTCHEEEEAFIKGENKKFISLARLAKYPIGSMYRAAKILAIVHQSNKKEYTKLRNSINKFYDRNIKAIESFDSDNYGE